MATRRIPADKSSVGLDALGNPLTNAAGVVQNGAESTSIQTDLVNGSLLTRAIFSDDGTAFNERTLAEDQLHLSGADGVWFKWHHTECRLLEKVTYKAGYVLSPEEQIRNRRYFTQGSCGGGFYGFVALIDDVGNVLVDDVGNILGYYP